MCLNNEKKKKKKKKKKELSCEERSVHITPYSAEHTCRIEFDFDEETVKVSDVK